MRRAVLLLVVLGCSEPPEPTGPSFTPGTVYGTAKAPQRGLLDRRGLIHAHSIYSHDACDGMPEVDGVRDEVCLDDFRRGLCQAKHDFVMLTDHRDAFSDTEFPKTLLYREARGDELVEHDGKATASWGGCPDGTRALILAGSEAATMPVGLESHVEPERGSIYGDRAPESIERLKANGAVVLVQHIEDETADDLANLPFDGFEMYNLHANTFQNLGGILEIVLQLESGNAELLPEPDLMVISFLSEDPRYLERWGSVLARGKKRVTTMGTDCHRNSFPGLLKDGERIDSYRRMMVWLSNHLLVRPDGDGTWNDRHLKEALRSGRLYGSFDVLGYPKGFDYHARVGSDIHEMGAELTVADAPELVVFRPAVEGLAAHGAQPELTVRILRAIEGGFDEVAAGDGEVLTYAVTEPGAYRAEVRMVPKHLEPYLGEHSRKLSKAELPWVYANAIYVR